MAENQRGRHHQATTSSASTAQGSASGRLQRPSSVEPSAAPPQYVTRTAARIGSGAASRAAPVGRRSRPSPRRSARRRPIGRWSRSPLRPRAGSPRSGRPLPRCRWRSPRWRRRSAIPRPGCHRRLPSRGTRRCRSGSRGTRRTADCIRRRRRSLQPRRARWPRGAPPRPTACVVFPMRARHPSRAVSIALTPGPIAEPRYPRWLTRTWLSW